MNNNSFGISFDFWNTLYGNGDESRRHFLRMKYFEEVISNYKIFDHKSIENVFRASTAFFLHEWQNNYRTPSSLERIQYMAKLLSVQLEKDDLEKICTYFGKLIFSVPPQNTAKNLDIIKRLAEDYPLGIISDTGYISGKFIREFLAQEQLISIFKSLVFSDEQDYCKPHPSLFKKTCENLNISCSNLIHIGDLEYTDIKGAKNSGCRSIRYTGWNKEPPNDSEADHIINNYKELLETIRTHWNS